jgi:signal peptidase I
LYAGLQFLASQCYHQNRRPITVREPLIMRWVICVAALLFLLAGCGRPNYVVMTDDMSPAIRQGDIVAVDFEAYEQSAPERGHLVVYHAPAEYDGKILVGRVVAVGGDDVRVTGGELQIGGEPVEEPFVPVRMDYDVDPTVIAAGQAYILGDNRNVAQDSHVFGPIPLELIVGRITDVQKPPNEQQ